MVDFKGVGEAGGDRENVRQRVTGGLVVASPCRISSICGGMTLKKARSQCLCNERGNETLIRQFLSRDGRCDGVFRGTLHAT